jgi:hypothetical protein
VMGRGTSRHGQHRANLSMMQIAVVVAIIVAMALISSRTAMFGLTGGNIVP